jgi:condensation domain-containing protein
MTGMSGMSRQLVPFEDESSGSGELSWGQRVIWGAMCHQRSSLSMGGAYPLTRGESVTDVATGLRFLLGRHESLRTRLEPGGDGGPVQVVAPAGEVPLDVVEAGGADPAQVAADLAARYQRANFDYTREWPVRMGVVTRGGVPTHLAEAYPHLVGDAFGLAALRADLAHLDPATGEATAPATGLQPLAQAHWQRSPAAERCTDRARRYWERLLRGLPDARFRGPALSGPARSIHAVYRSRAARRALLAVSARTKVSTSPVLLAAFAVALARVTGENPVLTQVVVSNRFRPGFATSVSPVNQACLCVIDVGGVTFGEAVARAWHSAMGAYKHAYYDPRQLDDLVDRIGGERGDGIDTACFFNDRRVRHREEAAGTASPPVPAAGLAGGGNAAGGEDAGEPALTWGPAREGGYCDRLFLYVNDVPGTLSYELWADQRYLAPCGVEAVLRGMADVLARAAADPAAATRVAPAAA